MSATESESTLRRRALKQGYAMPKSRRAANLGQRGQYMLVDADNVIVLGGCFDASLADVAAFLTT
jgi:hypothetical protein